MLRTTSKHGFHVVTPLLESLGMSKRLGNTTVYMKMENSQPTGSFKIRGVGYMCQNVRNIYKIKLFNLKKVKNGTVRRKFLVDFLVYVISF